MSIEQRRTAIIAGIVRELFADGKTAIRPGDVNTVLRERGMPMGGWEVRAEFTRLERESMIECNADTGDWHLTENAAVKGTG